MSRPDGSRRAWQRRFGCPRHNGARARCELQGQPGLISAKKHPSRGRAVTDEVTFEASSSRRDEGSSTRTRMDARRMRIRATLQLWEGTGCLWCKRDCLACAERAPNSEAVKGYIQSQPDDLNNVDATWTDGEDSDEYEHDYLDDDEFDSSYDTMDSSTGTPTMDSLSDSKESDCESDSDSKSIPDE